MHSNLEKIMGLQPLFYGCIFLLHQIGHVKAEICDSNGNLRLADRVTENEGRVEICLGGEWGTICDIQWGASDAKVACRQLGLPFDYSEEIFRFGGGSGPIHYSGFRCSGNETRLDECVVDRNASLFEYPNCYHQDDAGIRCTDVPCVENSIRIDVWIVKVCHNRQWGFVCVREQTWYNNAARLVCDKVGHPTTIPRRLYTSLLNFDGPVIINDVRCRGMERHLVHCSTAGYGDYTSTCTRIAIAQCEVQDKCHVSNSIRLTQLSSNRIGRLEMCANGVWGSVCNGTMSSKDKFAVAKVVCRELNHAAGLVHTEMSLEVHLPTLVPIKRTNLKCFGNESSLAECSFQGSDGDQYCTHRNDIIVSCSARQCNETEVRLSNGSYGRVEICFDGLWGSVCDNKWDFRDAQVVCRQLQLYGPSFPLLSYTSYESNNIPIHLDDVHCNGTENYLSECSHRGVGINNCARGTMDAGVVCTNVTCEDGRVRLKGGDDVSRGRVEYCYKGSWYSVCANGWNYRGQETRAVCRSLGYAFKSTALNFGWGSNPILPFSFNCTIDDLQLSTCPKTKIDPSQCVDVAGVTCHDVICEDGRVYLVGGDDVSRGRVEYCYQGSWYSVCANGWNDRGQESRAVCRSLGYTLKSAALNFERGSNPIIPFSFDCTIDDLQLSTCPKTIIDPSQCVDVAGVTCHAFCADVGHTDCGECGKREKCGVYRNGTHICNCYSDCYKYGDCCPDVLHVENCFVTECRTGDVRLVGGVTNSTGRLEVCGNGMWGKVCNALRYWGPDNTRVVCRQLGFSDQGSYVIEDEETTHVFGISEKLHLVGEVHCVGTESGWLECSHSFIGWHLCRPQYTPVPDIFISCQDDEISCEEGKVRLDNGFSASNGRVEYCRHRSWWKVCSEDWDDSEAKVICKQLGYNPEDAEVMKVFSPENEKPVFLCGVKCSGTEDRIDECQSTVGGIYNNCDPVGVICTTVTDDETSCEEGEVRLENGFSASNGHVEYCRYRSWGIVCSEDWEDSEAKVICKQLGYNPEDAEVMKVFSPENEKPVFLSEVKCSGTEDRIDECESTLVGINNCDPVGVICSTITNPSGEGRVVGAVVGTVIAILLIAGCVVFGAMLLKYIKNRKTKQIERMTLDIMATNRETVQPNAQQQINTEPCLNDKLIDNKPANPNPYCEPVPAAAIASRHQGSFPTMNENRPHLPSYHVRELTRGKFLVFYKDIILLECIGEGEFGIVYKARINKGENIHREVAIKTLKGSFNKEEAERFLEESLKMSRFRHAHVMGLMGVCLDGGPAPLIIMPFMSNGSLLRYLRSHRETLIMSEENDEDEVPEVCKRLIAMCCQIASGMEYLAVEKYVHRDLAARNCMIDMNFLIKITDFGLSEDVFERNYFRQGSHEEMVRLPVKWMAPESLSDGHFSEKSDVWSYGVTMWEIFSGGKAPYPGVDPLTLIKSLEDGHRMSPPSNTACNDEVYGMMTKCWEISPAERPSFKDIHSNISKYIGHIGGYLDMGVNPFNSMVGEKLGDQSIEASSTV